MKCTLSFSFNELKNIEISYKPTPRHNNYIYKSKEENSWILYQVSSIIQKFQKDFYFYESI